MQGRASQPASMLLLPPDAAATSVTLPLPAIAVHPAADAMRLPQHGRIGVGLPANFVVFRGRRYSELLSRPQYDRVRSRLLLRVFLTAWGLRCCWSVMLWGCSNCGR